MEYCPFYGEKWEGCRRCIGIDREENPPAFDNCFPGDEIDENETTGDEGGVENESPENVEE